MTKYEITITVEAPCPVDGSALVIAKHEATEQVAKCLAKYLPGPMLIINSVLDKTTL